ncbi:DUF1345 domain-containing protein [Naumannella cuiyingiana]|uniref:Putative membrane protein n=1 Tax=Naumannella cuiyingiana TaxID=1347891 RepID=A0A7Z0D9X9_9ACTN|nr:DUF1345 domain-containing protein [Naumannella cuiyingiana]NYI71642.1 putative membrane protein [Naumannella cuiyingiana]
MTTSGEPIRRPSWLLSETRRSLVSTVAATVCTAIITTVWISLDRRVLPYAVGIGCVVAWTFLAAINAALTWRAHGRLSGPALAEALAADPATDRRGAGTGRRMPSWSVEASVLALAVVCLLLFLPGARSLPALLGAALVMIAASWVNVAMAYALHYAREDRREPGISFPGTEERGFDDYLYLAMAIQTTFGTTDAEIRTRRMRRAAMTHGVLAFAFNTVIVAMIISLLLGIA